MRLQLHFEHNRLLFSFKVGLHNKVLSHINWTLVMALYNFGCIYYHYFHHRPIENIIDWLYTYIHQYVLVDLGKETESLVLKSTGTYMPLPCPKSRTSSQEWNSASKLYFICVGALWFAGVTVCFVFSILHCGCVLAFVWTFLHCFLVFSLHTVMYTFGSGTCPTYLWSKHFVSH